MFEKYLVFVSNPTDPDHSNPLVLEVEDLEEAHESADLYYSLENDVAIYRRVSHKYHE